MTLLSIVQDAARGLNISAPSTVIGNSDLTVALLLRLAQQEGEELSRRHDWQAITFEQTHTTLAQVIQTGALPSHFDRMIYNAEIWNRTNNAKYSGPTTSETWQRLQTGISGGITGWWRLRGGELLITPAPIAGQTIAFEFVSKNFCEAAGGTDKSAWSVDTDLALIPERLITLGITWRWLEAKSMDYAEKMATYEREVERACTRDRGTKVIHPPAESDDLPSPFWSGTIDA